MTSFNFFYYLQLYKRPFKASVYLNKKVAVATLNTPIDGDKKEVAIAIEDVRK